MFTPVLTLYGYPPDKGCAKRWAINPMPGRPSKAPMPLMRAIAPNWSEGDDGRQAAATHLVSYYQLG
jgi:hypothetical protein